MTIVGAYLTRDGVVLGADSMSAVKKDGDVIQLLPGGQKLFELGASGRMCLCVWGAAHLNSIGHMAMAANLSDQIDNDHLSISDAAARLAQAASALVQRHPGEGVGYYLAGVTAKRVPECYQIVVDEQGQPRVNTLDHGGYFSGTPEYYERVIRGHSPGLLKVLLQETRQIQGLPFGFAQSLSDAFDRTAKQLRVRSYKDLSIRDAIDYVHAYLHLTIKTAAFQYGAPFCGGPIEIGFITTDRPFRWALHRNHSVDTPRWQHDHLGKERAIVRRRARSRRR